MIGIEKKDVWESGGQSTNSVNSYLTHKVSHALLGCAVGAAKSGDCASGAFGAVIGEVIAEAAGKSLIKDGEFSDTDEWLTRTAGTTAAIFGTSALGGDFNVASDTAQNAIDNNLLDTVWDAVSLGMSADELRKAILFRIIYNLIYFNTSFITNFRSISSFIFYFCCILCFKYDACSSRNNR